MKSLEQKSRRCLAGMILKYFFSDAMTRSHGITLRKEITMNYRFSKFGLALWLLLSLFVCVASLIVVQLSAKEKVKPSSTLSESLVGAWKLIDTENNTGDPSVIGSRLQFFTGKYWVVTQANLTTGDVLFHHGGTYTLKGDELIKSVEYANTSTAALIKQHHKFKIKIERDTLTQIGIGNPWSEKWIRAR